MRNAELSIEFVSLSRVPLLPGPRRGAFQGGRRGILAVGSGSRVTNCHGQIVILLGTDLRTDVLGS